MQFESRHTFTQKNVIKKLFTQAQYAYTSPLYSNIYFANIRTLGQTNADVLNFGNDKQILYFPDPILAFRSSSSS